MNGLTIAVTPNPAFHRIAYAPGELFVRHLRSLMELVASKEEITANLALFDSYRTSNNTKYSDFFCERLRLGKIFVYGAVGTQILFAPSRFAGYSKCTLEKHVAFPYKNGSITTPRISRLLGSHMANDLAELAYVALCSKLNVKPSGKERTYWFIDISNSAIGGIVAGGESGYPDEVGQFVEGATKRVVVNAYERDPEARASCLSRFGYDCSVCGFNFGRMYGELGDEFIHVHHLTPISATGVAHAVNPINDLRPVCPNCHAMLHKSDPPFSIDEMKELLKAAKNA